MLSFTILPLFSTYFIHCTLITLPADTPKPGRFADNSFDFDTVLLTISHYPTPPPCHRSLLCKFIRSPHHSMGEENNASQITNVKCCNHQLIRASDVSPPIYTHFWVVKASGLTEPNVNFSKGESQEYSASISSADNTDSATELL
jgi:hypothetical protein